MNRLETKSLEFKQAVLGRLSLAEVVFSYIEPAAIKQNRIIALCPYHAEKSPSFAVYENNMRYPGFGLFHCYGCKATGNAIDFIEDMENLSAIAALRRAAALTDMKIPPELERYFMKILDGKEK